MTPPESIPRVGVVGVGALGKEHARIYSELDRLGLARFAGLCDSNAEAARSLAARLGVRAFDDIASLAAGCDALSIVTPTVTHFAIARDLLAMEIGRAHV